VEGGNHAHPSTVAAATLSKAADPNGCRIGENHVLTGAEALGMLPSSLVEAGRSTQKER